MKDLNQFTDEVIKKVKIIKKRRKVKNVILSCILAVSLVFFVGYSNIIPLSSFDMLKYAYETYKGVYANQNEDTIFSFTNNSTAILSVNSVPYRLNTVSNTKKEFNFNANKMAQTHQEKSAEEYLDSTTIKVVFYDGGATISGNIYGINISIDVIIMQNPKMESGIWKNFSEDTPDVSNLGSYIVVNDKGESYYISDLSNSYELLFVSVYGKEFSILLDNYGAPSEFITVERMDKEKFGFDAIKLISHIGNPDRYFKLISDNNLLGFESGEFFAKYVTAKKKVEYLGKNDNAKYLPIKWQLTVDDGYATKLTNLSAKINLNSDGKVDCTIGDKKAKINYLGEWFKTDKYLIVILDKKSVMGKTFVIYNQNEEKSFSQSAKSNINIRDGFKTGYHDFDYFLTTTYYTVYWGSEFTQDDAENRLTYQKEYTLFGYYYLWPYNQRLPFSYDREQLPENGKVKIILYENQTMDIVFEDSKQTIGFDMKITEGTNNYVLYLDSPIYIKRNDNKYIVVKKLLLIDGALSVPSTEYTTQYGVIVNHYIEFVK